MKAFPALLGLAAATLLATSLPAAVEKPRASLKSSVSQDVGFTNVAITYSRPNDKGRDAIGGLAPFGQVWRTGANEATTLEFDRDLLIGGEPVEAGRYALFTIPGADTWTIILNSVPDQWGSFNYDESKDVLRFDVPAQQTDEQVETFTIQFANADYNKTDVQLRWEDVLVSFPIEESEEAVDAKIQASIERDVIQGGEPTWSNYAEAARYYVSKGKELDQAVSWYDKSLEMHPKAYWVMFEQARLLAQLDRRDEARAMAKKASELSKQENNPGFAQEIDTFIQSLS